MSRVIKFRAWDRRNKKIYPVVSIRWSYGSVLRHFHRGVPEGYWLPEEIVVILGNGKMRTFSYVSHPRSYIRVGSRRVLRGHAGRHIRDLTLLEFTDRRDKYGIEIYDGDILEYQSLDYDSDERSDRYVVEWKDRGFVAVWEHDRVLKNRDNDGLIDPHLDIVVIGNVYEHPHLLGEPA